MSVDSARLVSVVALAGIFQELVAKGELRQIEYRPEWAGATGYFEKMFYYDHGRAVDHVAEVADGELVMAVDDNQRWLLLGRYMGQLHLMFQRYQVKNTVVMETGVIYQSAGTPNALATLLELDNCSTVDFDKLLEFIGAFDDGAARATAIDECLTLDVSDIVISAGGADVIAPTATEPSNVTPIKKEAITMSNTTTAQTADNSAAAAAAAAVATGAAAAANAAAEAPSSDAGQTRAANGVGEITTIGYSTGKKVGLFAAGTVTGAALTVGGYFAWDKWFR